MSGSTGMRNPINDARLNDAKSKLEVVYDGSLTLWRTGANLDILIMNHDDLKVMELIAYNPACNLEAPRIYIDANKLESHFNHEEFEKKVEEKKEFFIKRRKDFILSVLEKEVFFNMAANYLTTRISQDKKTEKQYNIEFAIFLQPKFGDTLAALPQASEQEMHQTESMKAMSAITGQAPDGSCLDVVVDLPKKLVPVSTEHFCKLRASIFMNCLAQFEENTRFLQTSNDKAAKLLSLATNATNAFLPKYLRMNYNEARLRWVKAINRVLSQNYCFKVRALLMKQKLAGMSHFDTDGGSHSNSGNNTGRLGFMSSDSFQSPRGVASSVLTSPRNGCGKLTPINVHAAVTGISAASTSGSGNNTPKSRRAAGYGGFNKDKASASAEHSGRLVPSKDQIFTTDNKLPRQASKQLKPQKSKHAKALESDDEVNSLMRGVSSMLQQPAEQENLPRYAQSTISRFLMINDSFDIIGVNRTIAPAISVGNKSAVTSPTANSGAGSTLLYSASADGCLASSEEDQDGNNDEEGGVTLLPSMALSHCASAPIVAGSEQPRLSPRSLPPLQVA